MPDNEADPERRIISPGKPLITFPLASQNYCADGRTEVPLPKHKTASVNLIDVVLRAQRTSAMDTPHIPDKTKTDKTKRMRLAKR